MNENPYMQHVIIAKYIVKKKEKVNDDVYHIKYIVVKTRHVVVVVVSSPHQSTRCGVFDE